MTRTPAAIRVVLLDVDGVLVPPSDLTGELRRRYGIGREQLAEFFGEEPWRRCLVGEADLVAELAPYLARWGWPERPEDFVRLAFEEQSPTDERLLAAVRALRAAGVACGVASNQERWRGEHLERRMALGAGFDHVFLSYRLGAAKPQLEYYERIAARLGESPGAILFWDDRVENVEAARECGWNAELYVGFDDFLARLVAYRERLGLAEPALTSLRGRGPGG